MHNESMIYGYARVSTAAQDESGQVKQLKAAGCGKIFREKITGTTAERPELGKLRPVGRGAGDLLAEYPSAPGRLELAHLTALVLGGGRDAGVAVNRCLVHW